MSPVKKTPQKTHQIKDFAIASPVHNTSSLLAGRAVSQVESIFMISPTETNKKKLLPQRSSSQINSSIIFALILSF